MSRWLALPLLAILASPTPEQAGERDLADGIQQVKDGDFETALLTLDRAVQSMGKGPEWSRDRARAYVYLGVAYVGLRQESLARSKFRLALREQRDLRLSPDEFSARAIRAFEAAREAEAQAAAFQKDARKSKSKGGLILLGVGGAAAAGLGVVLVTERGNQPPTVTGGTLNGIWRASGSTFFGVSEYLIDQEGLGGGATASVIAVFPTGQRIMGPGFLDHPRGVRLFYEFDSGGEACSFRITGTADTALRTIAGSIACNHKTGGTCSACGGREQAITLVRQ